MRSEGLRRRGLWLLTALLLVLQPLPCWAGKRVGDNASAFMSATFGLSSKRTQKRMETSGAEASDFVRDGRLRMKGTFEGRSAVFVFGFHKKKGLNYKSVYIASTGNASADRAFYEGLRDAYNIRFGKTQERVNSNVRVPGRISLQSVWKPNKDTTVSLSYNPEMTSRFPGEVIGARPIHLIYSYSKWS